MSGGTTGPGGPVVLRQRHVIIIQKTFYQFNVVFILVSKFFILLHSYLT